MFPSPFLNSNAAKKLDRHHVHASLLEFPDQIAQVWAELSPLSLPSNYDHIKHLLVCGMGGSALGARVLQSALGTDLKLPVTILTDYNLPAWVDKHTLVIFSSYSGSTEETLSCARQLPDDIPAFVLTTGGDLAKIADSRGWPAYILSPLHNPSSQPRLALGYNFFALLTLLHLLDHTHLTPTSIDSLVDYLKDHAQPLLITTPQKTNPAKTLADKLKDNSLILISSQHLDGAVYAGRNMLHENAKTVTHHYTLPELNHHLLEGLTYPKSVHSKTHFIFFDSDLYPEPIKKRFKLTIDIVARQGYRYHIIKPDSDQTLTQVCETIQFLGFLSFYLALTHRIDPSLIPWVDYFKSKLKN